MLTSALAPFNQSPIDWDAAMRIALELCDSTITYRTRAETPGSFHGMPARALGMYAPELVGNSAEWRVRVRDR